MVSIPAPRSHRSEIRVVWTRGAGCLELAEALAPHRAVRVTGDLHATCIEARAELLVARKLSSFDLTSVAVPHDFDPEAPDRVVALVSTGPHSALAARVAATLGVSLGLPSGLATAYEDGQNEAAATEILSAIEILTGLEGEVVRADSARDLMRQLGGKPLLVLGAAGGRLLSRLFFGPGPRLRAHAPVGAVVVRAAPERVYQQMFEPVFLSGHLRARDAASLLEHPVTAVVEEGVLTGLVTREALWSSPESLVSDLMREPLSVDAAAPVTAVAGVAESFEGAPIPVIDSEGLLVGSIAL